MEIIWNKTIDQQLSDKIKLFKWKSSEFNLIVNNHHTNPFYVLGRKDVVGEQVRKVERLVKICREIVCQVKIVAKCRELAYGLENNYKQNIYKRIIIV